MGSNVIRGASRLTLLLNLSGWIERRKDALGGYGDHIVHSVKAYEDEIEHLRATIEAYEEMSPPSSFDLKAAMQKRKALKERENG